MQQHKAAHCSGMRSRQIRYIQQAAGHRPFSRHTLLAFGTIASAQASKMLLVLPLCALLTNSARERGKAARSQDWNWSR
jgi:hypothetical protein